MAWFYLGEEVRFECSCAQSMADATSTLMLALKLKVRTASLGMARLENLASTLQYTPSMKKM